MQPHIESTCRMHAIKSARHLIEADPSTVAAKTLSRLVLSLEAESDFNIASLYTLDIDTFELAMEILKEWRIDRYYAGKAKLFDLSYQLRSMAAS